jgi:hypothetical protein
MKILLSEFHPRTNLTAQNKILRILKLRFQGTLGTLVILLSTHEIWKVLFSLAKKNIAKCHVLGLYT